MYTPGWRERQLFKIHGVRSKPETSETGMELPCVRNANYAVERRQPGRKLAALQATRRADVTGPLKSRTEQNRTEQEKFLLPVFLNLELCASVDASSLPTKLLFFAYSYTFCFLWPISQLHSGLVSTVDLKIVWFSSLNSKTRWYRLHKCP